jgi:hypothetical protein
MAFRKAYGKSLEPKVIKQFSKWIYPGQTIFSTLALVNENANVRIGTSRIAQNYLFPKI